MSDHDMPTPMIIPAQPGWFRLWLDGDSGELFAPDPVLAWEVISHERARSRGNPSYFIEVYPVTTEGRVDSEDVFLLRPDGRVEETYMRAWDSLEVANSPEERARRAKTESARRAELQAG